MHEIELEGCRATPLAGYLKGLAVLRLVAEQADSGVKGAWQGDVFHLYTKLSDSEVLEFFLDRYAPTPIVAPWNGGSGFYAGDASAGIDAIAASTEERFAPYRRVIAEIRKWPEMPQAFKSVGDVVNTFERSAQSLVQGKKKKEWEALLKAEAAARSEATAALPGNSGLSADMAELESSSNTLTGDAKKMATHWWKQVKKIRTVCLALERHSGKDELLNACRGRLPDSCLSWLDAAYTIRVDGQPLYNPLLGTGGNEGRLDFTNNFMQRIATLLIAGNSVESRNLLEASLHSSSVPGLTNASIGQFDPGRAGGYNQGTGVESKTFKINLWDFVLMLEGACVLSGSVCKRNQQDIRGFGAIPFTVRFSGVGFASSESSENGRAESWLPLWSNPTGYGELKHLFGEGRCSLGRRDARSGLDFTRALGCLGVDRGIDEFVRYAFVERRGTNYVALPAGRLPVRFEPSLRLLDDLDPILARVDGFLRAFPSVPATFETARRRIDEAIYGASVSPEHEQFSDLVRALGRLEQLIAQRDRSKKPMLQRPLYGLRPSWISHCDNGQPEVRIAAALASIRSTGKVGPIRANTTGVDAKSPWLWATASRQRHWYGNTLTERLAGVLSERMMDADRFAAPVTPLRAAMEISPPDVAPFLYGETNDQRIEELLWGFTLVDWSKNKDLEVLRRNWAKALQPQPLPRGWCMLKLLHQPHPIRGVKIKREPRIQMLLAADRAEEAVAVAHRRLQSQHLNPLPVVDGQWVDPQRQRAALLIPTRERWLLEGLVLNEKSK